MRLTDDPATAELLTGQFGLVTRQQLLAHDWSAKAIDGAVRRHCLEAIHRGVYRIPGSARPAHQLALAAVLRAGAGARITGAPVLDRVRLRWLAPSTPTVVLLRAPRRLPSHPVPWRRDLAPDHDHVQLGPMPATSPARAFVEEATTWSRQRQLTIIDHLRWDGLATTDDIIRCATRLTAAHRGAHAVLELVSAGDLQQESHGERDLAAGLDRLGLGALVQWQVKLAPELRVDCLLPLVRAVLEYDGVRHHTHARDRAADARRDRRIQQLGYRVVRLTRHDLRSDAALRAKLEHELGIDVGRLARIAS